MDVPVSGRYGTRGQPWHVTTSSQLLHSCLALHSLQSPYLSSYPEELCQVVELSMNVSAYADWALDRLHKGARHAAETRGESGAQGDRRKTVCKCFYGSKLGTPILQFKGVYHVSFVHGRRREAARLTIHQRHVLRCHPPVLREISTSWIGCCRRRTWTLLSSTKISRAFSQRFFTCRRISTHQGQCQALCTPVAGRNAYHEIP